MSAKFDLANYDQFAIIRGGCLNKKAPVEDGQDGEEAPLEWMVDTLETLKTFPKQVQRDIGYALGFAQEGKKSAAAKPFKCKYSGVFEIVAPFDGNTFRAAYAIKIGAKVYVLHVFQKKSKTGIATPRTEVVLIEKRYKAALTKEKFDAQN
jgi:phage-related protein